MNVIYKGARYLKDMYNQLNPATLTGAIDILVIEQEDQELVSSPFHVRFGKLGVLRAREKIVDITVNDEVVGLHMKLGDQGEAFFVEEACGEDVPSRLITSPLPSRPVTPELENGSDKSDTNGSISRDDSSTKQRKRRKRRKRRSVSSLPNDTGSNSSSSDSEDDTVSMLPSIEQSPCPKKRHPVEPQLSLDLQGDEPRPKLRVVLCRNGSANSTSISLPSDVSSDEGATQYKRLCSVFSDSELPTGEDELFAPEISSPYSDSEAFDRQEVGTPVGWDWGELPSDNSGSLSMSTLVKSKFVLEHETKSPKARIQKSEPFMSQAIESLGSDDAKAVEYVKEEATLPAATTSTSVEGSPKKKPRRPTEGLYLDEVLDLEPNEANLYLSTKPEDKTDTQDANKENGSVTPTEEMPLMSCDAGVDSGTDCVVSDDPCDTSLDAAALPMKMSLCGGKLEDGKLTVDEDKFQEKLVAYEQFAKDPFSVTQHPDLVIRLGERYCDWEAAGPLLLSMCVFKKTLSDDVLERMIHKQLSKRSRIASGSRLSWFWRRSSQNRDSTSSTHSDQATGSNTGKDKEANEQPASAPSKQTLAKSFSSAPTVARRQSNTEESSSTDDEIASIAADRKEFKRAQTLHTLFPSTNAKMMRKTTRLTSDQLKSLNLKPGANTVTFSVISQYQGTSKCYATIYLWKCTDRLVVSDIDGTITKSDVFGQILPVVGKDWTQGGVAQLYDSISRNGYKFIYLSARAIGQAGMTKGYLNWINQQGVSLPPGPLFLSPTSLISAFRTEVIEKKPEKFKIQCLEDIKALFPSGQNPLTAGFGNKKNDVVAYTAVGIPEHRVFTINPRGELKQENMQTYTTSYSKLENTVDNFFPALDCHCIDIADRHEYSELNYWRDELPDVVIED